MKHKLSRISMVLSMSGMLAAGLAPGARAAATANAANAASTAKAVAAGTQAWHTVLSVPNGTKQNLFGTVIATGSTSGWAFPQNGTFAYERTGAATWQKVPFPRTGGSSSVNVAGASSPSNVWVAYEPASGGPELYRWNGSTWTLEESFKETGLMNALSVLGPSDVWAFSSLGRIYHYNGSTWTEAAANMEGGSALSDSDVWAFSGTDVEHYNGSKWTATNVAGLLPPKSKSSPSVTGILALAPNDVYATGERFGNGVNPGADTWAFLRYDGSTWSRVAEESIVDGGPGSLVPDGARGTWFPSESDYFWGQLFRYSYSSGQLSQVTVPSGVFDPSVSQIPGTSGILLGGYQQGSGTGGTWSVVLQYS